MYILKEKWLISAMLKSVCLKSWWLWLYQHISNTLLGCAGGRLQLSNYDSWRCLCQQQHIHLSMAALRFTIYRNLFKQRYVPRYLLSDKDILLIQILACSVLNGHLQNAVRQDARFSTWSLVWPQHLVISRLENSVSLGAVKLSLCDWLIGRALVFSLWCLVWN